MQISMSVQQTTADVVMKPTAVTLWAASVVPVNQDTPEMDSLVLVSLLRHAAGMLTLVLLSCKQQLSI